MILANSEARLLQGVPLSHNTPHTLDFSSRQEQTDYFLSKSKYAAEKLTFVREGNYIRWKTDTSNIEDVQKCNYVMYRNINNGGKWHYAFVTKVEYVNDNMCNIHITQDFMQTYYFDFTAPATLIDRKHTSYIPKTSEGIDYGQDYNVETTKISTGSDDVMFLVITASENFKDKQLTGTYISGVPVPYTFYVVPIHKNKKAWTVNGSNAHNAQIVMGNFGNNEDTVNKVLSYNIIRSLPFSYSVSGNSLTCDHLDMQIIDGVGAVARVKDHDALERKVYTLNSTVNNKLDTYPYKYYELTDTYGNKIELKPEMFDRIEIYERTVLSYMPKTMYNVVGYLQNTKAFVGVGANQSTDIPVVNTQTAAYFQSHRNSKMGVVTRASQGVVGGFLNSGSVSGAIGGGIGGAIVGTAEHALSRHSKELDLVNQPQMVSGSVPETIYDFAFSDMQGAYIRKLEIVEMKKKHLKDFWHVYGYKNNSIERPFLRHTKDFMFVKTMGALINGNIPQEAKENIRSQLDNGLTIWYNKDVGNYSLRNEVV